MIIVVGIIVVISVPAPSHLPMRPDHDTDFIHFALKLNLLREKKPPLTFIRLPVVHCILSQDKERARSSDTAAIRQPASDMTLTDSDARRAVEPVGGAEDDLTLRASLYGVLFQAYADKVRPSFQAESACI